MSDGGTLVDLAEQVAKDYSAELKKGRSSWRALLVLINRLPASYRAKAKVEVKENPSLATFYKARLVHAGLVRDNDPTLDSHLAQFEAFCERYKVDSQFGGVAPD